MSNGRSIALALLLVAGRAPGVEAQDAARFRAMADSLGLEWSRLRAAQRRRDSLAAGHVRLDTNRVGPMTVLSPPEHSDRVVAGMRTALGHLRTELGRDTMLLAHTYYLRPTRAPQPFTLPADLPGATYDPDGDANAIAFTFLRALEQRFASQAGPALRAWAGGIIPLDTATRLELSRAFREVVGYGAAGGPDCVRGDLGVCSAILQVPNAAFVQTPYPIQDARRTLLRAALDLGGEGAYGRLLAAQPSVAAQLEAAAGVPLEVLLRTWHQAMLSARPESTMLTRKGAWVSFLWVVVFGAIASRSSRWRVI